MPQKKNYTTRYNSNFLKIDRYKVMRQMIPFVGAEYNSIKHKKILIIGESHYFPPESKIHLNAEKWYKITYSQINEEEECWTSTANIVKDRRDGGENKPGHKIYEIIGKAIDASRPKQTNEGYNMSKYYAYYNYFQRPAIDGDSLEVEPIDSKKATEVFRKVINVLKPDIVCVVSSKVWYNMEEKDKQSTSKMEIDFFPHPACIWWNRKSNNYKLNGKGKPLTGREKFIKYLTSNSVFK